MLCPSAYLKNGTIFELTANQKRKPLIGTGMAEPIGFVCPRLDGLLLLGTDGFFNYAKPNAILTSISKSDFQTLPRKCIDMVRLPSGDYWDDVGIIAVRHRPRPAFPNTLKRIVGDLDASGELTEENDISAECK